MDTLTRIRAMLYDNATTMRAVWFKTGAGHYAEQDKFIGVPVPVIRKIAKQHASLSLADIQKLLRSEFNEERLLALILLTHRYNDADLPTKEFLYQFYVHNLDYVNNWNLVDSSAYALIGAHLSDKSRDFLYELAASDSLWRRRIAIVATYYFIRQNDVEWTFKIATILRNDTHDLLHKAVGWMLREAGKRDHARLILFLDQYASTLPRTMLRYAIEKLSKEQRNHYRLKN